MEYTPDARPRSLEELQFEQRSAVRWFSPGVLARSGLKVVLSSAFGDYLDKRELQTGVRGRVSPSTHTPNPSSGSTSSPTAATVSTPRTPWRGPHLNVSSRCAPTPRLIVTRTTGRTAHTSTRQIVIFGGDEVYPVAKVDDYQDRFVGPFKAALPWTNPPESADAGGDPRLLAIPATTIGTTG